MIMYLDEEGFAIVAAYLEINPMLIWLQVRGAWVLEFAGAAEAQILRMPKWLRSRLDVNAYGGPVVFFHDNG
ncbi:hypothetical protein P4H39_06645 [Paenibacillus lautus]|uniref:hypothetical protein n=1 Tax=Paenibacillus lautus TaxID=1401 RepID=UPI002DC05007|nr:hypothetical protein [Paenibacillus lautus]MEC0202308.1 hypothetical protein [Paenibacillus lautus]